MKVKEIYLEDLQEIREYDEKLRLGTIKMTVAEMLGIRLILNTMIFEKRSQSEEYAALSTCYDRVCESVIGCVHTRKTGGYFK